MSKVYVVVRTIGESTLLKCLESLIKKEIPFSVVRYKPLELAAKETIRTGFLLKGEYDWVIGLDADVELTMNKEEIERYCDEQKKEFPDSWCFTAWLDCTERGIISGTQFFRTEYCERVYNYIKDRDFSYHLGREEYEIKKVCKSELGLGWELGIKKIPFGIHYFKK